MLLASDQRVIDPLVGAFNNLFSEQKQVGDAQGSLLAVANCHPTTRAPGYPQSIEERLKEEKGGLCPASIPFSGFPAHLNTRIYCCCWIQSIFLSVARKAPTSETTKEKKKKSFWKAQRRKANKVAGLFAGSILVVVGGYLTEGDGKAFPLIVYGTSIISLPAKSVPLPDYSCQQQQLGLGQHGAEQLFGVSSSSSCQ